MLKWPIPVLFVTGVVLFLIGWRLCFDNKREQYEK
jgi:hypothetical protein